MHPAFYANAHAERAKKMKLASERAAQRGNERKARKFAAAAAKYQRQSEIAFAELENMGVRPRRPICE